LVRKGEEFIAHTYTQHKTQKHNDMRDKILFRKGQTIKRDR